MTDDLTLTPLQQKVMDGIEAAPAPGRHAAKNAVEHLRTAWKIRNVDRKMCGFRCQAAEEEAATAIFQSLKRHGYPHADKLKNNDHAHKWSVGVFIEAVVAELWTARETFKFGCAWDEDNDRFVGRVHTKTESITITPPFNFTVEQDGKPATFKTRLDTMANDAGVKSIQKLIDDRANKRNQLQYAASTGVYQIEHPLEPYLEEVQERLFQILKLYLMIAQWPEIQSFVRDCLQAFLPIVPRLRLPKPEASAEDGDWTI